MNRFHVHVRVGNVDKAIPFYTTLFGTNPNVVKSDYAKWMLDEPKVNFAISKVEDHVGLSHLGIQVDGEDELEAVSELGLKAAGELLVERRVHCGYARGNKSWANDPQGVRWENFHTYENDLSTFGCGAEETWREDRSGKRKQVASSCGPSTAPKSKS